jgi:hydroxyacylglutathione hydrolase
VRFIDVRRPEEYHGGELGYIQGAKLVTLETELNSWMNTEKDRQMPTVFICRSGARSGRATVVAKGMGFENVYNMQGGMLRWNQQKLPVEK